MKVLTASEVDKEVVEARRFRPKLCSFWILTTAPDDAGVQEHARLITDRRSRKGLFDVIVLGWGEICRRATLHAAVAAKHFGAGGALPQRPLLAVWFASGGRLELTGKELELSCRELAHDLRDYPGGRLVLRQRESDALAAKLGFYEGRNFKVAEREARLLLRDKLAHNEYAESRISKGLELMLGDPTIACYLLEVYRDSGDAARAVAAFVQHELDPQKGVRKPGTFQLRVHAPDDPSISRLRYISQAQMTSILQLMESRTKRFGHVFHSETVSELPDEVRAAEAIPAIIRALLRELDNGRSLEELRKSGALQIGSWHAQIG